MAGPEDLAKLGAAGAAALSLMTAGAVPKMHERKNSAALVMLDPGSDEPILPGRRFQYYPASISDTKAVNYAQKSVPGGSLPLYQWINGGERTISFTVMFSSDIDLSLTPDSDLLGVPATAGTGTLSEEVKEAGVEDRNVDIAAAVLWLRRMMLPAYSPTRTYPPPKVLLWLPGTGIGASGGLAPGTPLRSDMVLSVMTQCDVEYKALFPSGTPRLVSVQLAFAEIPQAQGLVRFPAEYYPDRQIELAVSEGVWFQGGYNLESRS